MRRFPGVLGLLAACVITATLVASAAAQKKTTKPAANPSVDAVVATVNGVKITRYQVADEILADQLARLNAKNPQYQDRARPVAGSIGALVLKQMAAAPGKPARVTRDDIVKFLFEEKSQVIREAVQNRIRELAIAHYAKAQGVQLTEAEISKQVAKSVDNARTQLRMQGKSDAQVLADLGYRGAMLRRGVTSSLYIEKLIKKELEGKIGHALGPDDFRDGRHILIRVNTAPPPTAPGSDQPAPAPDPEKAFAEVKTKIDAIAQEIANKAKTFEQAAKDSSDDPSKFREGSLGPFVRGLLVPEFEAVAFSLPVGVVSQPVRTQFGWHLIRIDRMGSELSEAERDQAWQAYVRGRAQALVSEIMAKAKIVNKVGPPEPMMGMPGMR